MTKVGTLLLKILKEVNGKKHKDKAVFWALRAILDEMSKDSFDTTGVEVGYEYILDDQPNIEGTFDEKLLIQKEATDKLRRVSDILNKTYGFSSKVVARSDRHPSYSSNWVETPWLQVTFKYKKVEND